MAKREVLLMKQKHQYRLFQLGECVYGPNHENKGDYYVDPCLSQLIDEFWFWKVVGSKVFLIKPKHQFIYPNKENEFVVPNL